jgi:nucleotide-binding universal stress UspA family protein
VPEELRTMRGIRRIVVAVKNPAAAELPAVGKAAQLARALGAELTLFQAISAPLSLSEDIPPRHLVLGALDNYTRSAQEACLKGMAQRLHRRGIRVSQQRNSSSRRLTDWELLRRSPVPILLVKRPAPYRRPSVLAALDPDHTFNKPPRLDADILAFACAITAALRGSLHAVYAYAAVAPSDIAQTPAAIAALTTATRRSADIAAKKLARATRGSGIAKAHRHVVGRHVPDAIEQVARENRSAIVIMGAVARSGLKRLLIGNTAERVLDQLSCDVLLVKSPLSSKRLGHSRRPALQLNPPLVPL